MSLVPVKIRLLLTALIVSLTVLGQNDGKDSLLKAYKDPTISDSLRIDAVTRYAYRLFATDTFQSNQWYDTAKNLAVKKPTLIAIPFASMALVRVNNGLYHQALPLWDAMQVRMEKINFKPGIGNALYGKGLTYYYLQEFDTAIFIQQQALKVFNAINRADKSLNCYNNMASSYLMLGNYPAALENYKKANKIAIETKDTISNIITSGNCGMVYKYMEKYDDAMAYYQQTYRLAKIAGDAYNEASMLQKMGTILDSKDSSMAAIGLYRQALALNLENNFERPAVENKSNIGIAFYELGMYDSAWFYLQQSLPTFKKFGDQRAEGIVISYLGKVLANSPASLLTTMGISPNNLLKQARQYHQQALSIFQEIETPYDEAGEWEALANIYQKEGNYKLAFEAMQNLRLLKDSIFKDETKEKIVETELKYEQEKREALLLAEHNSELNERRLIQKATIAGAIIALLATIGIYTLNRKRLNAKAKSKEAELVAQKVELENKALRSQMNPHFIFNALNSIADYVRKNEGEIAEEYLTKFARLMRLVLENSEHKEVPLSKDMEALQLYMDLEALRSGKNINYSIIVSPEIDAENTLIPPLLMQPFIENSIWHGIMPKHGDGKLEIRIIEKEGDLHFCIEDNGVGLTHKINQKASAKGKSMGIQITSQRISLLQPENTINEEIVKLEPLSEGLRVSFKLPFKPAF